MALHFLFDTFFMFCCVGYWMEAILFCIERDERDDDAYDF